MYKKTIEDHLGNRFENVKAMCEFYGKDNTTFNSRIRRGWTLEDALTKESPDFSCEDHLGKKYRSVQAMCKKYGVTRRTYYGRIKLGWTLEEALTGKLSENLCKDHLGNIYKTISDMCKTYNITLTTYYGRLERGWTLEEALTKDCGNPCKDHLGNEYKSVSEMCRKYGIESYTYEGRIARGWSVKDALTKDLRDYSCKDHLGNEYKSIQAMCDVYEIKKGTFDNRIKDGWTLEDALTKDLCDHTCEDHLGNEYPTTRAMCKAYGITDTTFKSRIRLGWTLEEALTIPKHMYIGEYRVAEKLKKMHKKFYHDCTIKVIFEELDITVDWKDFLNELQKNLGKAGYNWSVQKIQRLRPDFVIFTDEDNKIQGVIEFDGEQHQNFTEFFYKTIEQFYKRNNLDMAKQSLFEYLNIPMLRIRHDQVDLINEMVEDFVKNSENYVSKHNTYLSEDEYWSILKEEKRKLDLVFA